MTCTLFIQNIYNATYATLWETGSLNKNVGDGRPETVTIPALEEAIFDAIEGSKWWKYHSESSIKKLCIPIAHKLKPKFSFTNEANFWTFNFWLYELLQSPLFTQRKLICY